MTPETIQMNSIKFRADMIPLILSGRKTQTRRLEKKGDVGDVLQVVPGLTIQITAVSKELLRSITEFEARAEGILDGGCLNCGKPEPCGCDHPHPLARDSFVALWDSIYSDRPGCAWADNPTVWVHTFRVVEDET